MVPTRSHPAASSTGVLRIQNGSRTVVLYAAGIIPPPKKNLKTLISHPSAFRLDGFKTFLKASQIYFYIGNVQILAESPGTVSGQWPDLLILPEVPMK